MGGILKKITITFPMLPIPKGRPRARKCSNHIQIFTPQKTKEFEKAIAEYYKQSTKGFQFDKDQPIIVNLVFGMPIPKSAPKVKQVNMCKGNIKHTKKPDIDNLVKSVLDGLNGVAWEDDSQIVRLSASKEYSSEPYIYLYIHESVD